MKVSLIAQTVFYGMHPDGLKLIQDQTGSDWAPDAGDTDAAALTEFAGRACYNSWDRPNPATATNAGYMHNVQDHKHWTVGEHASTTFYVTEVSRSLTHELVRHRHHSFSQLSQRFVILRGESHVVPPLFEGHDGAAVILERAWARACVDYDELLAIAKAKIAAEPGLMDRTMRVKRAREAARCVLPNMTPTGIVMTANHSAWRNWLLKRGDYHADLEIRQLAVWIYRLLASSDPNLYQDIVAYTHPKDGRMALQARPHE